MRLIGFSTGALAYADFRSALTMLDEEAVTAVELSALRFAEWIPLLRSLDSIDFSMFDYVSIHLPSKMSSENERTVTDSLHAWDRQRWPLILHPDAVTDWSRWRDFGDIVCVENMDIRKPTGRTDHELGWIFQELPRARLCFDIGHAWQVDPTMGTAYWILKRFRERLTQIHVSEVNSGSKHDVLSYSTIQSFRDIAHMIPPDVPVILETPVSREDMRREMNKARFALTPLPASNLVA